MSGKALTVGIISKLGSSMKSLNIESTASSVSDTFQERILPSRFSMVRRRAFDVDDGGMDAGYHGNDSLQLQQGDNFDVASVVGQSSPTGLSMNQNGKMRGIVRKTKKKVSTDSPRSIPVVRPIYTYARIFKPKDRSTNRNGVSGWSTPKNPVRLSDFSKSEASPLPGHTLSILSTPQRENPDWLLFKSPAKTARKTNRSRINKSKSVNDEPTSRHKKPVTRKPKGRTAPRPLSPISSSASSPPLLRKIPPRGMTMSSSNDSNETEPVASFVAGPPGARKIVRRIPGRASGHGRKIKRSQEESTQAKSRSRARSSASTSSRSPSPPFLRKNPRQGRTISSSDDGSETEPVASFLGEAKKAVRRIPDRASDHGRKLKRSQKESTQAKGNRGRAGSSASLSSTSTTVVAAKDR